MIVNNRRVYSMAAELVTVVQNGTLSIRVSNEAMTVQIFNYTTVWSRIVVQACFSNKPVIRLVRLGFFSPRHNGICERYLSPCFAPIP